jgi:hypothetical protein
MSIWETLSEHQRGDYKRLLLEMAQEGRARPGGIIGQVLTELTTPPHHGNKENKK